MREMLEINIDIHLQNIRKFNHIEGSGKSYRRAIEILLRMYLPLL